MAQCHLIVVGKLNDTNIHSLENEYLKRLNRLKLLVHEVKSHQENLDKEAQEVSKKISDLEGSASAHVLLLTEKGAPFSSPSFATYLDKLFHTTNQIIFIIGGASGHGAALYERANAEISLSPLTFPHKLARLLLVEQVYRAQTILMGHPYSK